MGQIIINLELFVHFPHARSLLFKHIWPRSLERSTCDFQHAEYKTQEEIRHLGIKCNDCPTSQESTEGPWYRARAPETPTMPFSQARLLGSHLMGICKYESLTQKSRQLPWRRKTVKVNVIKTNHFHMVGDEL